MGLSFSSSADRLFRPGVILLALATQQVTWPALASQTPSPSDARINHVLGQLEKVRSLSQTAISPDGGWLAWVVDGERGGTEIELAPVADPQKTRRITAGEKGVACDESGIAWSPDGHSLAFLSDCQSHGQAEIYLQEVNSKGSPRRLSHLHGFIEGLQFSPDGKQIGFLYVEGATRPSGALAAMKPPSGVIGEDGLEIQRVARVPATGGEASPITPENLHVYEFDWSPDSKQLAYIAAPPPGENNWWVAKLYTQSLTGKSAPILDPATVSGSLHGLQIAVPRWSPDGKTIAFIGGLMSDQGATGGDLYYITSEGGLPMPVPSIGKGTVAWFTWLSTPAQKPRLLATEIDGGTMAIVRSEFDPEYCEPPAVSCATGGSHAVGHTVLLSADVTLGDGRLEGSVSLSADGRHVAFMESSFAKAPEVYSGAMEQPVQVTHYNDALKPAWGKSESVHWENDSFHVQGWLLYPADYDPTKKYPMIVVAHGGPSSAVLPRWPGVGFGGAPFSALGYFVFEPNPRGSYGQGEVFTQANRKDFGYGDLRDILAGVDAVTAKYPVDPQRIGLTGWSYGGFMTMFAVTQTHRFQAAVAGAGIANWQSYYGQNSIDQWMTPFFGATVYDDPAVYAKSSAIEFIHQVKTPTLVVVGDRDGECPAPQSFEFWHALRSEHVPTQLVVYPNEGHHFVDPAHRRDVLARGLAWFEQYMPSSPSNSVAERQP
jgi:dipeptidyl aminopeptidase/acylaminoacyl peptidase